MPRQSKRSFSRHSERKPILLQRRKDYSRYQTRKYYYTPAVMHNSGRGGLYFEADYALQPGVDVRIRIENQLPGEIRADGPFSSVLTGKVRWCKTLDTGKNERYGIGMEILTTRFSNEM